MKKAIVIGGIALAVLALGRNKVASLQSSFKNLNVKIKGIRNISFTGNAIKFNLDIDVVNAGDIAVDVATFGAVTLKRLIFKDEHGQFIGESYPEITNLSVPARGMVSYPSVPTSIPLNNIGKTVAAMMRSLSNPTLLNVVSEIETPAGTFLI